MVLILSEYGEEFIRWTSFNDAVEKKDRVTLQEEYQHHIKEFIGFRVLRNGMKTSHI